MLKTKKSKFKVFTILSIAVLVCLFPLATNYDNIFGFKGSEDQTIDGDVDVSVSFKVELDQRQTILGYLYYVEFDFTFNTSVSAVEIERINYRIYHNTKTIYRYSGNYFPNAYVTRHVALLFGDNLTCQGSVDLNYQLNSIPQNATVNYNIVYTHSIRGQDAQGYFISKIVIFIAYIASFFLLPIILYFTIHPEFHEPTKEEKEKTKEYLDYIAKWEQEKRKENSTKN